MKNLKTKKVVRKIVGVICILLALAFFGEAANYKKEYEDVEKQTMNVLRTGKVDHSSENDMYIAIVLGAALMGVGVRLIAKKSKAEKLEEMYGMQNSIPEKSTNYVSNNIPCNIQNNASYNTQNNVHYNMTNNVSHNISNNSL